MFQDILIPLHITYTHLFLVCQIWFDWNH